MPITGNLWHPAPTLTQYYFDNPADFSGCRQASVEPAGPSPFRSEAVAVVHSSPPALYDTDLVRRVGRDLRHHPASARRLPHDADGAIGRRRAAPWKQERSTPCAALRARSADLRPVLEVDFRHRPPRRFRHLVRTQQAGDGSHLGSARLHLPHLFLHAPVHLDASPCRSASIRPCGNIRSATMWRPSSASSALRSRTSSSPSC